MASTITPIKSSTVLFSTQAIAANTIVKSATIDVSTKVSASILARLGRTAVGTLTGAVEGRLESSGVAAANDFWLPFKPFTTALHNTAAVAPALASAQAAAATNVQVATITGLTNADSLLFLYDGGAAGVPNSEWFRVSGVTTPNVTANDSLTRAHSITSTLCTDQAEEWCIESIDLRGHTAVRLAVDTAKNVVGQTVVFKAIMIMEDGALVSP
jgi:hypothetical protein